MARGAIAGALALAPLSSFEASSAVTRSSRDWVAAALLPEAAVFTARSVYLSIGRQSEGHLSCCDARAVSHLSVVQTSGMLPVTGPSNMFSWE